MLFLDAEPEQIKLAYKRLALKYHPDKHKNSQIAKEVWNAYNLYEILSIKA